MNKIFGLLTFGLVALGAFGASTPISGLPELTSPATNDWAVTVDISDTTSAATGTTKKIAWWRLLTLAFDPSDDFTFTGSTVDFTAVNDLLLPPDALASIPLCCSNAFVRTDSAAHLEAVLSTNQPQVLADYGSGPELIDFYDIGNGDFWAEGIGTVAASAFSPLLGAAVSSGTLGAIDPTADNHSVWAIGSTTAANTGYSFLSRATHLYLAGGERTSTVIRFVATNTVIARGGFLDVVTATEPTDGAYWEVANGYMFGRTSSNSVRSTTTTSNLLDPTLYYRINTIVNTNASLATFELRSAAGSVVWTESLSANLPITAARAFGVGLVVLSTSTNTLSMANLDGIGFRNKRRLVR